MFLFAGRRLQATDYRLQVKEAVAFSGDWPLKTLNKRRGNEKQTRTIPRLSGGGFRTGSAAAWLATRQCRR
jgi:hypothetical protein